jgi:hypothetical protein
MLIGKTKGLLENARIVAPYGVSVCSLERSEGGVHSYAERCRIYPEPCGSVLSTGTFSRADCGALAPVRIGQTSLRVRGTFTSSRRRAHCVAKKP